MTLSTPSFTAQLHAALERDALRTKALKKSAKNDELHYWQSQFPDAPSAEGLHKHAERFSPDGVPEIRDAYQVTLLNVSAAPTSKAPKTRRTTESMKTKVLNLHERGVVPAAIADTLNISDRRVSEILRAA